MAMFCIQFALMDAWSGSISLFVCMLRSGLLSCYTRFRFIRSRIWIPAFIAAFTAILIGTWAGPISLLSYAAACVTTVAYWTNNAGYIRISNLLCAGPCWLIYDILVGS